MFNNKVDKSATENFSNNSSNNLIGKGTVIEGSLDTSGNLRIEGTVKGDVKSKSKVVIGQSAVIEGNVKSANVEIFGTIKGYVEVFGLLTIKPSAVVLGDIMAKELVIEPGAKFDGQCKMAANEKDFKANKFAGNNNNGNGNQNGMKNGSKVMPLKEQLKAVGAS